MLIFEHKVYDVLVGLDYVKIADLGILPNRNALMFGNVKESIKSDSESEDEITPEKINNEEVFISSILEATEDDIVPEDDCGPNPRKLRIHVKEGLPEHIVDHQKSSLQ